MIYWCDMIKPQNSQEPPPVSGSWMEDALAMMELSAEVTAGLAAECQCSLRSRLVGDGCSICNPSLMEDILRCEDNGPTDNLSDSPAETLTEG